ncbi:hypothetical protein C2E23DRAFT_896898 [Lenzites betulinus]|nr:hypothetical protein C2E23DRAFT_896898 [Lenzites betulinus]
MKKYRRRQYYALLCQPNFDSSVARTPSTSCFVLFPRSPRLQFEYALHLQAVRILARGRLAFRRIRNLDIIGLPPRRVVFHRPANAGVDIPFCAFVVVVGVKTSALLFETAVAAASTAEKMLHNSGCVGAQAAIVEAALGKAEIGRRWSGSGWVLGYSVALKNGTLVWRQSNLPYSQHRLLVF